MRQLLIMLVGLFSCISLDAIAMDVWSPEGKSPDEIADHFGLNSTACLNFVDASAVEFRTQRWLSAIRAMSAADPQYVMDWIVGAAEPPRSVVEAAQRQKDCMIQAMVAEAATLSSPLVLDWSDRTSRKDEMPELARRFARSAKRRQSFLDVVTRSDYRDARTQSWIWKRKHLFKGNSFNRISPESATRCGLTAGYTWKPHIESHRRCWLGLEPNQREREILGASSAPGISRHHWGTDFDLYSLNPRNFVGRARMADEYVWLKRNGVHWGFFQPYSDQRAADRPGYMEERWHWSYYPIAQALLEFGAEHEALLAKALNTQWDLLETRWNASRRKERSFFGFVRAHWRDYMFNVDPSFARRGSR